MFSGEEYFHLKISVEKMFKVYHLPEYVTHPEQNFRKTDISEDDTTGRAFKEGF